MMRQDSVTVSVRADKLSYAPGEAMRFTVELVNRSPEPVTLEFSSSQRQDFLLRSAAGNLVWQWSADLAFLTVMGTETLVPGASRRYEARFTGRLEPGSYELIGRITSIGPPLQAMAKIEVR